MTAKDLSSVSGDPSSPPDPFFASLQAHFQSVVSQLQQLDVEAIARQTGFLKRSPRKIPMRDFVCGLLAVAPETHLTLEHLANSIGLAAHTTYTKQSLEERLGPETRSFLILLATALLGQLDHALICGPALAFFERVLVNDSTSQRLPPHLADVFSGSGNQHGQDCAQLKSQWIADLKNGALAHVSLSGFTRNDQAAAPDILEVARPGDLILRDLGYFTTACLAELASRQISFLSRYRHDVNVYDPQSGKPLNLMALLKEAGRLDMPVLLGPERVGLRLVALPVPEEVANQRRHEAKASAQRRHRSPPGREHLFLMGWSIFVTNVPLTLWSAQVLVAVYRLRWRIEITFKTWKSHLGLAKLNCHDPTLVELSVLTKLMFCALIGQLADWLEINSGPDRHVSLLRLGQILGSCACWVSAQILGISVAQWVAFNLHRRAFYEQRKKRKNYYELFEQAGAG